MRSPFWLVNLVVVSTLGWMSFVNSCVAMESPELAIAFRAGAATVDVTPITERSIVAGGFLEAQSSTIHDRLFVRSIVLDDGTSTICLTVVDTCMMTQSLIDDAKLLASKQCGIPISNMMVSATQRTSE